MTISTPGIGSGLDVNGIISKLMQVESAPLTTFDTKEAGIQAQLSAFGSLSGALASFQSAVASMSTPTKFQGVTAGIGDSTIVSASATSQAVPGSYSVNVTQLAQAQTIATVGVPSTTSTIGDGSTTTLSFQFGTISGGSFAKTGTTLGSTVATNGIAANSLSINGTTIATSSATKSAKNLATQINLSTTTTGVTATAAATNTGTLAFAPVTTDVGDAYSLVVGTTTLASIGASSSLSAADLDAAITTGPGAAGLAADGITFTGSAVGGDLHFTQADGSNINITQTLANASSLATGGIAGLTSGATTSYTSAVSLASAAPISVSGVNSSLAGLTPGNGVYSGASYVQDPNQASGTVTIDNTDNSLQGIRDAINKANVGVTASIVSDGSATPYHLILTSNKTGATSSMKISVNGDDGSISNLLAYDPAGTQNMSESSSAASTMLTVNGIPVTSTSGNVSEAIQGTSLVVNKIGATTVTISHDTTSVTNGVNQLVKAYNDIDSTLKSLTAYDPTTKVAGPLLGDSAVRDIQAAIRKTLSTQIGGLSSSSGITNLSQVGISFQKDGSLVVDPAKLQTAVNNNFSDIGGLFAAMGKTTDSLISFTGSSSATQAGTSKINVTALATHGNVTGSDAAGLTITAGVNDALSVTVDGTAANVTLTPGIYTSTSLAAQIQSAINGASTLSTAGIAVSVTDTGGGVLGISSNRYGSASNVNIGGTGAANILGSAPITTTGIDVAGTIDGVVANGSGQTLTGAQGAATGLQLKITGGAIGDRGTISFSRGYADQLNTLTSTFLGTSGLIAGETDGLKSTVKDIDAQRDAFNLKLVDVEARYKKQYSDLDVTISTMQQTQSYLTQQLAAIANLH